MLSDWLKIVTRLLFYQWECFTSAYLWALQLFWYSFEACAQRTTQRSIQSRFRIILFLRFYFQFRFSLLVADLLHDACTPCGPIKSKAKSKPSEHSNANNWHRRWWVSVTRFGEILPLWHKLKCLWQFFEGLFSIWQKLPLTLVNFVYNWAISHGCKWTLKAIWSHWRRWWHILSNCEWQMSR